MGKGISNVVKYNFGKGRRWDIGLLLVSFWKKRGFEGDELWFAWMVMVLSL